MKKVLLGSHAVSYGVQLCRAQVVSAYPITPQTHIVEELSEMCRDGRLNARFIKVESEHSAMACILGAASAGARVFTATSSHGLALMHEVLHWAAGSRLPIVLANVNRAIGPPWSIMPDQGDSLAQRDTGWIQFFTESGQEAMDTIIQAYKIAEQVLLPVMVNLDGFFLSHTSEVVNLPEQDAVDAFLPPFDPPFKLDTDDPRTFGALCADDRYAGFRYDMQKAMDRAREITEETDEAFGETFERRYFGPVESYKLDEAETALVTSGTITGSARVAVDQPAGPGRGRGPAENPPVQALSHPTGAGSPRGGRTHRRDRPELFLRDGRRIRLGTQGRPVQHGRGASAGVRLRGGYRRSGRDSGRDRGTRPEGVLGKNARTGRHLGGGANMSHQTGNNRGENVLDRKRRKAFGAEGILRARDAGPR